MEFIGQGEERKSSSRGGDNTIPGTKLEDNLDVCLGLEPHDFHWWNAPTNSRIDANHRGENVGDFQDCTMKDIANLLMF